MRVWLLDVGHPMLALLSQRNTLDACFNHTDARLRPLDQHEHGPRYVGNPQPGDAQREHQGQQSYLRCVGGLEFTVVAITLLPFPLIGSTTSTALQT